MYDYLVVGSGLYGATFAHEAHQHGKSVLVIDKRPNIAGNIYTETTFGKIYHRYTLLKQTLLHVDKFKELGVNLKLYQGANWMDIPRDAVCYFMDYFDEHENVRKLFMTGYCSDEFWIQTILKNSEFESRIDGDIHRYIKWEKQYDNYPAVLDEREFPKIKAGNYQFARKFNPQYSAALKRMIDDELHL